MKLLKYVLAACACLGTVPAVAADDYPNKPIRMVVGYAPGGATDIIARLLQVEMSERLGQTVIVDNRPGANGTIANRLVANAEPDGYTLLMGNPGPLVINPIMSPADNIDVAKTLTPVSQVTDGPLLIVVRADSPLRSMQDVIEAARREPGKLSFGSPGIGSPMQIIGEALQLSTGTQMVHVPYKGSGPAIIDLLAGTLDFLPDSRSSTRPFVKDGKLRVIAVTGSERLAEMPDVPTVMETGVLDFSVTTWLGVMAPMGTPQPVVEKLHRTLADALAQPELRKRIDELGSTATGTTPAELGSLIESEHARFGELLRKAGLAPRQ